MSLNIKIKLKSQAAIAALLEESTIEEEQGLKHTDGVLWEATAGATYEVKSLEQEYQVIDIETTTGEWLNPKWVKEATLNGEPVTIPNSSDNKRFISIGTNLWVDTKTSTVVTDIPTCKICQSPLGDSEAEDICEHCLETLTAKKEWNWKPSTFTFYGEQKPKDRANPIWYGLELEYGFNEKGALAELMHDYGDSVYLKSDGSISGGSYKAELVSQPHSFTELMKPASFINRLPNLDVDQQESDNGCHIHISRTSFVSDKHYSMFYFLINSNAALLQYIGNRKFTQYCKHSVIGKVHSKTNNSNKDSERTVVINEVNDATVEVRFFNSTKEATEVKTYLQFVDSLIKYTKYHTDEVSLQDWRAYVSKYSAKYTELDKKLEAFDCPMEEVIVFREPVKVEETIKSLTLAEINNIISISTVNGDTYVRRPDTTIQIYTGSLEMYCENCGTTKFAYSEIKKIVIERM